MGGSEFSRLQVYYESIICLDCEFIANCEMERAKPCRKGF